MGMVLETIEKSDSFQHIFVMRFSYPALGGFKMSASGLERAIEQLYDPERLERRLHLFEKLTLPSLLSQSEKNFQLAIIIGKDMPPRHRNHLEFLLARMPNATLFPLEPIHREVAHVISLMRDRNASFLATTRLDDDDAISNDCVDSIQRTCRNIIQTKMLLPPVAIAFNNGLFLEKSEQGAKLYGVKQRTPLGIGLTLLTASTEKQTVYTRNHRQAAAYWNCISDAANPSFIRSVHKDNDSGARNDGIRIDYSEDQLRELLRERFTFSLDDLLGI